MNSAKTSQLTEFFEQVLIATRKRSLDWTETAQEGCYLASLGNDLAVQIELIPDLDMRGEDPDHKVTLFRGSVPVMELTREDVEATYLARLGSPHPYVLFKEVWERAQMRSTQLDTTLGEATALLKKRAASGNQGADSTD